jgi:hypothetical protein
LLHLAALAACLPALALAAQASPDEIARRLERGRQLYVESTSPSGGEVLAVLGDGIEVAAAAVPCAGCHGHDGHGRPEGGLTPTDITWDRLSRPYGAVAPGGRRHPPYDAASLERSLVDGVDPAGTPFHMAMPRYRMSAEDLADLVAYLQTLGAADDPGVTEAELSLGVFLPSGAEGKPMAGAVRAALARHVAAWNARGGSYGRTIALRFLDTVDAAAPAAVRRAHLEEQLAATPVLAAVAAPQAGAEEELAALCEEWRLPLVAPFAAQDAEPAGQPRRYVFELLPSSWRPRLIAAGAASPAGPRPEHLWAEMTTVGAADVLLEALTRAGRAVTRERLVEALEAMNRYETGYLPPISFAPGRRLGVRAAGAVSRPEY